MTQWFVGNLLSGKILTFLNVKSGSWSTELNGPGGLSVTVPLSDPSVAALGLRNVATVKQTYLGVAENGVVLNAGPIFNHSYSADDRSLQLDATGLWSLFQYRLVMPSIPAGVTDPGGYDTYLPGLDSGTVAKRVLQQAAATTGGALPIVFQPDVAGTSDVTYFGEDFTLVSEVLDDLVGKGVDVEFAPRFTADLRGVEWLFRTGTDASPLLLAANPVNPPTWDASVAKTSVRGLQVKVDGSRLTGRVWETTGSNGGSFYSRADNPSLFSQGYPFYESVDSTHNDVEDQTTLNNFAKEAARVGSLPTELWSFDVRARTQPLVGSYRCGDYCAINVGADPYIGRGKYVRRITNLSGDQDGKWVSVTTGPAYSVTG